MAGLLLTLSGIRVTRARQAGTTAPPSSPGDTDFAGTLRNVPLRLVVGLDLLDFGLDILAAPLSWWLLDRAGLRSLRAVASIEALIPFTQPIPLLTLCWLGIRLMDRLNLAARAAHRPVVSVIDPGSGCPRLRKRVLNTA